MNSQQELLNAINAISESKDKSFDTPATVLRVEDDTVWVHIDGGADETPVRKTVSCEQGETVQVRISNGSAFLVGNASAPPTDDKVANVAHFVAEQADVKATSAEETAVRVSEEVSELEVEVDGKVDVGNSNIQHLSSTMYQNANGVNIFNDTLAVGDSYAHIDGDSFDVKKATTAGTIDDVNDTMVASFGQAVTVGTRAAGSTIGYYSQVYGYECTASGYSSHAEGYQTTAREAYDHAEGYQTTAEGFYSHAEGDRAEASGSAAHAEGSLTKAWGGNSHAEGEETLAQGLNSHAEGLGTIASGYSQHVIGEYNIDNPTPLFIIGNGTAGNRHNAFVVDWYGNVYMQGDVCDLNSNRKTPKVLTSTTISSSTTSYTFTDAAITTDSVIDIYDTIFGFAPTAMSVSAGSCTVTFPAQSSSHTIKLFVY